MAEGLLRSLYGEKYEVFSAGTEPSRVNPYAVRAMHEIGIDISEQTSKTLAKFDGIDFDYVVTVCNNAKESCPVLMFGKRHLHKGITDPSRIRGKDEEILAGFRTVRDELKNWIESEFSLN